MLIRAAALAVASFVAGWLVTLGEPPGTGAAIGAGLIGFLTLIVLACVWGGIDGYRARRLGRPALVWLVVAVLVGVASALQAQGFSPGLDLGVLASDLTGLTPFVGGLVLLPAVVGAAVGALLGRRRRAG